ncbi:hypothetical protein BD324DRAFT_627205 [Kockovaella imperatae]|uniref:ubiquitinyl hydrolase 1 n=1 Tax=Kockovaella imperatae TaxID=4999 RepID=A0A1Y1UFF5_9TREE|nr:hypothetical protein BD324DRAFT_627205 [Kockovaella imperatae]ORX36800.1 hypothetical protein BD324DRAFT_627205 [Kockovaella imperatae]
MDPIEPSSAVIMTAEETGSAARSMSTEPTNANSETKPAEASSLSDLPTPHRPPASSSINDPASAMDSLSDLDPRSQAGSSRTKYFAAPVGQPPYGSSSLADPTSVHPSFQPSDDTTVTVTAASDLEMDESMEAPYRPPEAVEESPEDQVPDYVPELIAEHPLDDKEGPSRTESWTEHVGVGPSPFDDWTDNDAGDWGMDLDSQTVDRPQIGPGVLPRRWLKMAHKHDLVQPKIGTIPKTALGSLQQHKRNESTASVDTTAAQSATREPEKTYTADDVWAACPGGLEHHHEWFFCVTCWGWIRIVASLGPLPDLVDTQIDLFKPSVNSDETIDTRRTKERARLNDLLSSRAVAPETHHHLHEFETLIEPTKESRIERIDVSNDLNTFPHISFAVDEDSGLETFPEPNSSARLFASCSSDLWMVVDRGIIPGQLPIALVNAFTREKGDNPNPGASSNDSVRDAWELLSTLLFNPIFKGQRGWVKLENKRFQNKIGTTLMSSRVLRQIGFGCQEQDDTLRVGPFSAGESITPEQVSQMDKYMMRTWVEIGMYLAAFIARNDSAPTAEPIITIKSVETVLNSDAELSFYRKTSAPYPDSKNAAFESLGITKLDEWQTVEKAYKMQITDDAANVKLYLSALEEVSTVHIIGRDRLQTKVATERSMGRYTIADLREAYSKIGFTPEYASEITVEPEEAPDSHILELHKKACMAATTAERREISQALVLIGRDRDSQELQDLGKSGETFMSLDDAYAALSAPRDSIDDGLIMQYQLAISDFPGKTNHYRNCLEIIASAPGEERPAIKMFLETGKTEPDVPVRKDIPVGLQNIGNTCYLNSILQYIYSIKPLRDEVLAFEQEPGFQAKPTTREEGRSRRFVRQLRLLFLQMYKSDQSSVRPDEELAYLAITRPEVDQLVQPAVAASSSPQKRQSILDNIPTLTSGSPSSTRVASPGPSPMSSPDLFPADLNSVPPSLGHRQESVLGKRASTDRDDSSRSSMDHSRLKSEDISPTETKGDEGLDEGYFSLVPQSSEKARERLGEGNPRSPSAVREIEALKIGSPPDEDQRPVESQYSPPKVPPPLPPRPHVDRRDTLASGLRFGLQQDSAEVLINVLSQLEMGLEKPAVADSEKLPNLIQQLFSCKYRQQLFYQSSEGSAEGQTPVESVFVHPIIGVEEEGKDLYDCLAELYLGGADIEYEGKKGYMMDLMDEFPPFLYIQMRRSQFDLATGRERKLNTHIGFDQVLAMDRFLANADASKREQSINLTRQMTQARARLQHLRNHKPMSIPDTIKHVRDSLGFISGDAEFCISSDFLEALDAEVEITTAEIAQLEDQIKILKQSIEGIWTGSQDYEYELVAVFMHRGKTSGAGHYWTYQAHLPDKSEEFFKYNDETVTVVPRSEVLQDRTGSDANPALLCYVRKGRNLIDTLHREVLEREEVGEAPSPQALDVGQLKVDGFIAKASDDLIDMTDYDKT